MIRICLLAAVLFATGCSPVTVSFTLFADERRLSEAVVDAPKGASDRKILILDVRGLIADRHDLGLFGQTASPVDDLAAGLRKAESDPNIKAVVLRINSPGGTVAATETMYREVRGFAERTGRPVVASLGEIAASGGYYLALSADRIVAEPATIAGSIGVIIPSINVSEGLNRIGIRSRSIVSRPNKDLANPLEPMEERHYEVLQAIVDEFYAHFRGLVAERRGPRSGQAAPTTPLDAARFEELTDGRVVTGARAVEAGLADQTGGLREAVTAAQTMAGVGPCKTVKYFRPSAPPPRTAYAQHGDAPAGTEFNLLQLRIPGLAPHGPGVYYLWIPPL
jgi:protease IV